MTGAERFQRLEAASLARIAGDAARAALRRIGGSGALVRRSPVAPRRVDAPRRAPAAATPQAGDAPSASRAPAVRCCSVCGEPGHRADGPRHRTAPAGEAEPATPPPAPAAAEGAPPRAAAPPPPADDPPEEAPPPADPSDDEAFVPEVVARARAKHCQTATGRVRAKTISGDHMTRGERRAAELVVYPDDIERPRTREECRTAARPCPFVSCSHHLYLDVNEETGAIKLNFPHLEVWQMAETCSLDVADRGGITLEETGAILNLTRERIRQVEVRGLVKLKAKMPAEAGVSPSHELAGVEDRLGWR